MNYMQPLTFSYKGLKSMQFHDCRYNTKVFNFILDLRGAVTSSCLFTEPSYGFINASNTVGNRWLVTQEIVLYNFLLY